MHDLSCPEMAAYAEPCHRAALCADPVGFNPPYALLQPRTSRLKRITCAVHCHYFFVTLSSPPRASRVCSVAAVRGRGRQSIANHSTPARACGSQIFGVPLMIDAE